MANRKRKIQMKFGVTAEEKELIMVICHYGIITGFSIRKTAMYGCHHKIMKGEKS